MEWLSAIKEAIKYMEDHLLTVEGPEEVAGHVHISSMYLQRGFQVMTGFTLGEYIRNRRLYLAAIQLVNTDDKIIDVALQYGYDTPESFTKAFVRFHQATPTEVRRNRLALKPFLPLKISIVIQGGNRMNYKTETKGALKVIGFSREFSGETSYRDIPKFWDEIFEKYEKKLYMGEEPESEIEHAIVNNRIGEFGICIDDIGKENKFNYMVAGRYMGGHVPTGMEVYEIPKATWAVFKCNGPIPESLQTTNTQIWNEWLPGNSEYEVDGKYNVEWYSPEGNTTDADYQSAIWIPVKTKEQ